MRWSDLRAAAGRMFFANFFAILLFVVSAAQWMFLWWLVGPQRTPAWMHLLGVLAVYAINRRITGGRFLRRSARRPWRRFYDAFAFTSLFCSLFLVLLYGAQVVAQGLVGTVWAALSAGEPLVSGIDLDAAFGWLANAGVGLICLAFVYGYTVGQSRLRVARMRLRLRGFDRLDRLRIVHITDIHAGQNLTLAQLERFVERVNEQDADLVCITGDIADNVASDLGLFFPVLGRLRARHAVIAVLGNHDHYAGARRVEEALRHYTDFVVLRDQHIRLDIDGVPLHVVGLDDRGIDWARGIRELPYLAETVARLPAGEAVLLLCHRPDIFHQSSQLGVGLTLSGHTHGGQIALPWIGGRALNPARLATDFDRGLFRNNGSYLYVNSGLGVTGQRVRLCTPREIAVFDIRGDTQAELQAPR